MFAVLQTSNALSSPFSRSMYTNSSVFTRRYLWHTWNKIELKYGMQTEFTRRVASLDLVICHLGGTAFFLPFKYLANAPSSTKKGVIITAAVLYVIFFYFGMALMKLSQSIPLQVCTMLLCCSYLVLYYFAGRLSESISGDGGIPHR